MTGKKFHVFGKHNPEPACASQALFQGVRDISRISGHTDLGHMVKGASARFVQHEVSIFPFVVNLSLQYRQVPSH